LLKSSSVSVVEEDGTMQTRNRGDYTIAGCELVAEGADLRVQVLTLAAGQCVPWRLNRCWPSPMRSSSELPTWAGKIARLFRPVGQ
jgi:hypothetical protein